MSEEEYRKYITPDEWERRVALMQKGIANARKNDDRKKSMIAAKSRWNRRREVVEQHGV